MRQRGIGRKGISNRKRFIHIEKLGLSKYSRIKPHTRLRFKVLFGTQHCKFAFNVISYISDA